MKPPQGTTVPGAFLRNGTEAKTAKELNQKNLGNVADTAHLEGKQITAFMPARDGTAIVANDGFYRHRIIINDQLEEHRYPGLEPNMSEEDLWKMGKYAQIVISLENRERAKELETKLREEYGDRIEAYANKYVVDVVPKGMSKATGIEIVRKKEGIDLEDLYTIGDAANDLTLMEYGYNGCVMDYALPEVKAHAKREYRCIAALVDDVMKNANE